MKRLFLVSSFLFVIFFLGRQALNPFNGRMFNFHDDTQSARIHQFNINLKSLKIPPRIAPSFSNRMGFPVFNFYAPTPYWITSLLNLSGFDIPASIKLSFLLALIVGFYFMFKFLNLYFGFYPSLLGSALYVSSPWMAVEIFIRGNLAEIWFLAFLPFVFLMTAENSKSKSPRIFVKTVLAFFFGLTAHNVLSIVLLPLLLIFILLNEKKLKNIVALMLGFSLAGYFFVPAILEMPLTHAATIAKNLNYVGHLLCPWQLWTTPFWGYGGSGPDCNNDGMSFMLGKPQIITAVAGLVFMIARMVRSKKDPHRNIFVFFILMTIFFIFMSTTLSAPVSKILEPILSMFQFPWRFSSFSIFGLAFLSSGILFAKINGRFNFLLAFAALFVIFYNGKFFTKHLMTVDRFNKDYLSDIYISKMVVYKVAEYLPKTVNYQKWLKYEPRKDTVSINDPTLSDNKFIHMLENGRVQVLKNGLFDKEAETGPGTVVINIHYMPYWQITVNKKNIVPETFDLLGRPVIKLVSPSYIKVSYKQTFIEKLGNTVTAVTVIFLIMLLFYKKLWKKTGKIFPL